MRRPAPHPATPSCTDRASTGPCSCGWRHPCTDGCIPTIGSWCVYCGSDDPAGDGPTHVGGGPDCTITASIAATPTVCSCGWRHPDWASMEWQMWISGRDA